MSKAFSAVFASLRAERKLSQRKVAEELGISQALLSHYENGIRQPRFDFVVRACKYYGVSADYLLGMTDIQGNPITSDLLKEDSQTRSRWEDARMRELLQAATVIARLVHFTYGEAAVERLYSFFCSNVYKALRIYEQSTGNVFYGANVGNYALMLSSAVEDLFQMQLQEQMPAKDAKPDDDLVPVINRHLRKALSSTDEAVAELYRQYHKTEYDKTL